MFSLLLDGFNDDEPSKSPADVDRPELVTAIDGDSWQSGRRQQSVTKKLRRTENS